MMDKAQLIEAFTRFLEDENTTVPLDDKAVDLFSLFSELAALKTEVKLEARQTRRAIDEFKNVLNLLESNNTSLEKQLNQTLSHQHHQHNHILRPILLDIVDISDRLNHNMARIVQHKKKRWQWWRKQEQKQRHIWSEGLSILSKRIEQCLADHQVTVITTLGQPLNSALMRVSGVHLDPLEEPDVVVEETRRGYLWKDEVLRLAEVIINKRKHGE